MKMKRWEKPERVNSYLWHTLMGLLCLISILICGTLLPWRMGVV